MVKDLLSARARWIEGQDGKPSIRMHLWLALSWKALWLPYLNRAYSSSRRRSLFELRATSSCWAT